VNLRVVNHYLPVTCDYVTLPRQ